MVQRCYSSNIPLCDILLQDLIHREDFDPAVHFRDRCPENIEIWESLAPNCMDRLAPWHYIKNTVDTFRVVSLTCL